MNVLILQRILVSFVALFRSPVVGRLIMRPESEQDKTNRRGCSVFAVAISVILVLLVAISLGWLGQIDRKITDLPVIGGS